MMSVGMALSTALGIVAIYLVHEWVGVAIAAVGIAHFGVRYRFRILDRYNARKRKALIN